jgi:hypothetical protein
MGRETFDHLLSLVKPQIYKNGYGYEEIYSISFVSCYNISNSQIYYLFKTV